MTFFDFVAHSISKCQQSIKYPIKTTSKERQLNMKKKRIIIMAGTAVIVFLMIGFIFVIVLYRNKLEQNFSSKREKQAIKQVLSENARAVDYYYALENTTDGLMTIVGRRRSIDTSKCPNDFRSAYKRYVRAWDDMLDQLLLNPEIVEDESFHKPLSELDIDFNYIVSRNTGEDSGFQARIQAMLQRQDNDADLSLCILELACYSERIANAWSAVQSIAVRHGVNPN